MVRLKSCSDRSGRRGPATAKAWPAYGSPPEPIGIGTALLAAAESWGGDRGARIVRLTTYAGGPVAVPFYERHGGYERRSILFQKPLP